MEVSLRRRNYIGSLVCVVYVLLYLYFESGSLPWLGHTQCLKRETIAEMKGHHKNPLVHTWQYTVIYSSVFTVEVRLAVTGPLAMCTNTPCMSLVVPACIATPFVPVHIFSELLRSSWSFVGIPGKLDDFMVFRHVLMYSVASRSRICPVLNALQPSMTSRRVRPRSKVILSKFHRTRMIEVEICKEVNRSGEGAPRVFAQLLQLSSLLRSDL